MHMTHTHTLTINIDNNNNIIIHYLCSVTNLVFYNTFLSWSTVYRQLFQLVGFDDEVLGVHGRHYQDSASVHLFYTEQSY